MKRVNVGIFVKRHKLKMIGAVLALIAFNSVAEPMFFDPSERLQRTFDRVEASLSLNEAQAQAWATAESATLAQVKAGMERRLSARDRLRSALAEDTPDLHALSQSQLGDMDTHLMENKANHEVWLGVYDSLTTEQQALVRKALLAELTKMENRHRKGLQHMESSRSMRAPTSSF